MSATYLFYPPCTAVQAGVREPTAVQEGGMTGHADDITCDLELRSDEDGLARDVVHVQTDARFEVAEVNETVLHDEVGWNMVSLLFGCGLALVFVSVLGVCGCCCAE